MVEGVLRMSMPPASTDGAMSLLNALRRPLEDRGSTVEAPIGADGQPRTISLVACKTTDFRLSAQWSAR